MNFPNDLLRGDTLLYWGGTFDDRLIAWKEGDPKYKVGHIEVYAGNGQSWASRNDATGQGINLYPFRPTGIMVVRRPFNKFDTTEAVDEWFKTVQGMPYGMDDNLNDAGLDLPEKGFNCSHTAALLYVASLNPQFDSSYPLQAITPDDFNKSLGSYEVYCHPATA